MCLNFALLLLQSTVISFQHNVHVEYLANYVQNLSPDIPRKAGTIAGTLSNTLVTFRDKKIVRRTFQNIVTKFFFKIVNVNEDDDSHD